MPGRSFVIRYVVLMLAVVALPRLAVSQPSGPANAASAPGAPDLNAIITRMEQAQQESDRERPYSMVRDYRLLGSDTEKANSEVRVRVNYLPPDRKTFDIVSSSGSGRGAGIVRRILESEAQLARKPELNQISRRNYAFRYSGERMLEGRKCYLLGMEPLRKEAYLLQGSACVDAQSYRVLVVEGEPARIPSWWLKRLHMTMRYGQLAGLWLPLMTDAVAEVRFFGKHTLMSRAVAFSAGEAVAEAPIGAGSRTAKPVTAGAMASVAPVGAQATGAESQLAGSGAQRARRVRSRAVSRPRVTVPVMGAGVPLR